MREASAVGDLGFVVIERGDRVVCDDPLCFVEPREGDTLVGDDLRPGALFGRKLLGERRYRRGSLWVS